MENTAEEILKATKQNLKHSYRSQALQIAERLNPNQPSYASIGIQGTKPSVVTVLSDADKIYEWLIKEL